MPLNIALCILLSVQYRSQYFPPTIQSLREGGILSLSTIVLAGTWMQDRALRKSYHPGFCSARAPVELRRRSILCSPQLRFRAASRESSGSASRFGTWF